MKRINIKPLADWLKNTVRETANLLVDWLKASHQQYLAQQQVWAQRIQQENLINIQLQLQSELWHVFHRMTPPCGLINISYPADLMPDGWKETPSGVYFTFRWAKTVECRDFSFTALEAIRGKLNKTILVFQQRILNQCRMQPYNNEFLKGQFPTLCMGVQLVHIADNPLDVTIHVKV